MELGSNLFFLSCLDVTTDVFWNKYLFEGRALIGNTVEFNWHINKVIFNVCVHEFQFYRWKFDPISNNLLVKT